jgi:hypothetical protein
MNEQIKDFDKMVLGDYSQENDIVVASGKETKEYGFVHTWYVDASSAIFSGEKPGVRWEIIAVDKISEIITINPDDYENGEDDEEYKEMEKFIKGLEDSVCDGELIFNPENEMECYIRIW